MGVFDIGEKPRTGIPNCLMNRALVVEDKILGFASFPQATVIACLKTSHHGLESSTKIINGRPVISLIVPCSVICHMHV